MAMIKCPECNKEVSDKAYTCPNCGYPEPRKAYSNKVIIILKALPWYIDKKRTRSAHIYIQLNERKLIVNGKSPAGYYTGLSGPIYSESGKDNCYAVEFLNDKELKIYAAGWTTELSDTSIDNFVEWETPLPTLESGGTYEISFKRVNLGIFKGSKEYGYIKRID